MRAEQVLRTAVLAAALSAALLTGCAGSGLPPADTDADQADVASSEPTAQLLVLGRSVMTGWMEHWGGDASSPAEWEGYEITFREVEGPPGIGSSAASAISEAPAGSVVLFKFCFVDFNGGDYDDELGSLMGYVTEVADAAAEREVRLILGTALPKVAGETNDALVAEHEEFGRLIEEFAAERRESGQDVDVLDLNAVLADDSGVLRDGYAASRDDSHLNGNAYDALDEALLPLLTRES